VLRNLKDIGVALCIPEIHRTLLYILIGGILCPSFGTFSYYFLTDILHISQFTYALLNVLGFFGLAVGSALFNAKLKHTEVRKLLLYGIVLGLTLTPLYFSLVMRWNVHFGIPDMPLIIFSDIFGEIIAMSLSSLPMMVLFAKIIPNNIEATCFAFLTGCINFMGSCRGIIGSWINKRFVHVSKDNMDDFYILIVISTIGAFLPLLFLWLIPSRAQISTLQAKI